MVYLLIFIVGLLLSALIRFWGISLYHAWFYQGFVGDSSIHFSIIKQLQKNPKSRYIDQYVIKSESMSYPLAFHHFTKYFPQSVLKKYSYLPNLVIFSFFSAVFLVYLHYIEENLLLYNNYLFLITAGFFYFFSISNLVFYGPAIAYIKLSERLLARMSCSFYFLCLFVSVYYENKLSFIVSIPFGTIALLSSVFARQAILFTVPLLSLLYLSIIPVVSLIIIFFVSIIISRDYFLLGLKHTLLQWKLYKTHTKKSKLIRNSLSRFISIGEVGDCIKSISKLEYYPIFREPTRALVFYPEIILSFVLIYFAQQTHIDFYKITIPITTSLVIYLLTTTDYFNHLGESYRYIEYNLYFLLPLVIATGVLSVPFSAVITSILAYAFFVLMVALHLLKLFIFSIYPSKDVLTDFLNELSLPKDAIVFPISMSDGANICARTECKSFWYQPGLISINIYNEFIEEYPFLKKDWFQLFRKYKVTHVICNKKALRAITWQYDFSGLPLLYEDDNFIAYVVKDVFPE